MGAFKCVAIVLCNAFQLYSDKSIKMCWKDISAYQRFLLSPLQAAKTMNALSSEY